MRAHPNLHKEIVMRFLFRLGVLALAAVGAKTLFDRFAPRPPSCAAPPATCSARRRARRAT